VTLSLDMRDWSLEAVDFYTERLAHRIVDGREVPARAERAAAKDTRDWFETHRPAMLATWATKEAA
jgi:hypothetical protein